MSKHKQEPGRKMTATELVKSRLARLHRFEQRRPGCIKQTSMLWAFIRAVQ